MSDDQVTSVQSKSPDLEASLDTLENDCPVGSDIDFRPKLVNGKGPLDNFLGNRVETSVGQSTVIIDLTEDSNEQPDSLVDHNKLSSEASPSREAVNGNREDTRDQQGSLKANQNDKLAFPGETLSNIPYKTEEEGVGCGGAGRRGDSQECSPQSCPELTSGLRLCSRKEQDSWSEAGGILFRGKVPMVVLQDILAVRPPQTKSPPATPQGKDMTPESGALESCPEEDSVLSHSSLSSPSSTSSPEGPPAPTKRHSSTSPFPTSTPVRRVSISHGVPTHQCSWISEHAVSLHRVTQLVCGRVSGATGWVLGLDTEFLYQNSVFGSAFVVMRLGLNSSTVYLVYCVDNTLLFCLRCLHLISDSLAILGN